MTEIYEVDYPFIRTVAEEFDEDGPHQFLFWCPGVANRPVPPDDCEAFANGMGKMILTVVGRYKPGKYPERVFFTRSWIDPDGKCFGKGGLHICVASKFKRISQSYAVPFVLDPDHDDYEVQEFKANKEQSE